LPVFAAVDIGSNSVRLKIAKLVRRRLKVLHEDREVTRLGESVFQSGILDPASMEHTVKVLRRFHKATQQFGADEVRVVATSATRDAANSVAFMQWVYAATGWRVQVISGLEEGRLIHLGVTTHTDIKAGRMLLIDLGGGSCELTLSNKGQSEHMVSLPLGAVRLTRDFLVHDPPTKNEIDRLKAFIQEEIVRVEPGLRHGKVNATIATSGTPAALADMWSKETKRPSTTVPRDALTKLTKKLTKMNVTQRRSVRGIGPKRAEIIIPGAWVFTELLTRLALPSFRYVPYGLRDGMLQQMLADYGVEQGLDKRLASERANSVKTLAGHYNIDLRHAERVREHCVELFRALQSVHHLPAEYLELLQAAALLQEVGSFINRAGRHRHAYYVVAHSELLGYTPRERKVIAAVVRFVGKSRPTGDTPAMRALPAADRLMVPRATMLLRLSRALEQGRRGVVSNIRATVRPSKVILKFREKAPGAELELWALEKERNYFRELFGRELALAME
jgi:exopolyphosphatase / guanosine-5'-triphosphate,3'-diphosphate pyrophosphatase